MNNGLRKKFAGHFLAAFGLLSGCAGITPDVDPRSLGTGALGGVALTKTVEKVKEVFTPDYPFLFRPIEVCDIVKSSLFVECYLIPCHEDGKCSVKYGKDKFFKDNPKMITVQRSLFASAKDFCKRNEDGCQLYIGHYEDQKIVILEDKK